MTTNIKNGYYQELGERLSVFREIVQLSRQQMAAEANTPVHIIADFEKGEIKADLFFPYINILVRDFGLNFNWILNGNGHAFLRRGPKTPIKVYNKYYKGYYYPEDEQLLEDLIYLSQISEARESLTGQVIMMKCALKDKITDLDALQKPHFEKMMV